MNYFNIEEEIFEALCEELRREPTDEELTKAIEEAAQWEPDWDTMIKDEEQ